MKILFQAIGTILGIIGGCGIIVEFYNKLCDIIKTQKETNKLLEAILKTEE